MPRSTRAFLLGVLSVVLTVAAARAQVPATAGQPAAQAPHPAPSPQPRPHGMRVPVDPARIEVDDGDTAIVHWSKTDAETVRLLGIDTPETRHPQHDIPYAQPFGPEARAFAQGAFAAATRVEFLRASTLDPYGRTLAYFFLDGRNYSVLVVRAGFSGETVSFYGDNGLPREAAEVTEAAKAVGPLPFEPPHLYRARMRAVAQWMRNHGQYPEQ
jgi:endonuclease YncB( thermonuclease family)